MLARRARVAFIFLHVIDCQEPASTSSGVRRTGLKKDGTPYAQKKSGQRNLGAKVIYPSAHIPERKLNGGWLCVIEQEGKVCRLMLQVGEWRLKGEEGRWRIIPAGNRDVDSESEEEVAEAEEEEVPPREAADSEMI